MEERMAREGGSVRGGRREWERGGGRGGGSGREEEEGEEGGRGKGGMEGFLCNLTRTTSNFAAPLNHNHT